MTNPYFSYPLLMLSALGAGVVNTLAGGGTLLTFPTLLRLTDLGPVIANATSTVALVPGSLTGAWGYRRELVGTYRWLALLLGPSVVGGIVGALLLTRLEGQVFARLVPWLLLTASLLFLFQPLVSQRLLRVGPFTGQLPRFPVCLLLMLFQFLVAVYGGYFGAGIGVLMLSALGLMGLGDIHRMNAVKNVLAATINGVAVIIFIVENKVDWSTAAVMALGAIVGGYLGAGVGRRLPKVWVRWFVIVIGLGLAVYYFTRPVNSTTDTLGSPENPTTCHGSAFA